MKCLMYVSIYNTVLLTFLLTIRRHNTVNNETGAHSNNEVHQSSVAIQNMYFMCFKKKFKLTN